MKQKIEVIHPQQWPASTITPIEVDPFGSYTGRPEDILEQPVQDADDL